MDNFVYDVSPAGGVQNSGLANPASWLLSSLGSRSDSGVVVNTTTSLGLASVWQGVNIIAGDCGMLPLCVYRRRGDQVEEDRRHPASVLLRQQPNAVMGAADFRELMAYRALLWGNACAAILRSPNGRPLELLPLPPDATRPEYDEAGRLFVVTRLDDVEVVFAYDDVFHIKGLSQDGVWGLSLVQVAKNQLGHGLSLQEHGSTSFKNSARLSGVIQMDGSFRDAEQRKVFRQDWEHLHAGGSNANRVAILEHGMKFAPTSMSHQDAQWIEARRLDKEDVASLLNLPPHKLGIMTQGTFGNIAEQNMSYLQSSLQRWLNKWVEEGERKLLRVNERDGSRFLKWKVEAFLRGDVRSRAEAYERFISMRVLSPPEVRQKEDLPPYVGGDTYENPNTTPGGAAAEPAEQEEESAEEEPAVVDRVQIAIEQHDRLMRHEAGKLLRAEGRQLRRAAQEETNFVEWLQTYYNETLPMQLGNLFTSATVADYCSVRAAYVLTLTDGDAAGFVSRIDEDSRNESHRVGVLLEISNMENKQNDNL